MGKKITRRRFVGGTFASAATGSAALGGLPAVQAGSPANKVVLAIIGAGGRGMDVIVKMLQFSDVTVKFVCDPEEARGRAAVRQLEKIQHSAPAYEADMRKVFDDKDVQGVVIATPEQWHALSSIWACQAGKDVYVEKNISLSVWEGRKMIEAARKYKRIVQAGFQNRSAPYAFSARDYIAKGGLGKVLYLNVYGMLGGVVGGYPWQHVPDSDPPPGLNWDLWLGPARQRPYNKEIHRLWYGCWDFSGGNASDAIHTLDVARLILGDPPHPKLVQCVGGRFQFDDRGDLPDVQIVSYQYDKFAMTFTNTGFTPYNIKSPGEVRFGKKFPYWPQNADRIEIFGTKRMMYFGRHGAGWQVFEGDGKKVAEDKGYFPDKWHLPNFVDCIRTRQKPNGDIEQGHMSACLEHFANVAYRTGNQRLVIDAANERFVDNPAANEYLKPHYRGDYRVPDEV
jgi:hypothetical protein